MNILELLFKKKTHDIGIIRFGDSLVIPGREYFKDIKDIQLLENYKKHYIELLKSKSVVMTPYFNSSILKEQMNMYIDLLLRLLMDNDKFYLYASVELLVQITKLKMYYNDMIVLKNDIILRLVALKEVKKEKGIPRHNKIALEEEINSLSVILEMFLHREVGINIEVQNYLNVLKAGDLRDSDLSLLNERMEKLLFLSKGIADERKLDDDLKLNVAFLEKECEIYAYNHKDEALKIKESFKLEDENKILLFYEYGKDIFDYDFIKKFYLYKFNILVDNINNASLDSPINEDDYGFSFYEDIIGDKINNLENSYYFSNLKKNGVNIKEQLDGVQNYLKINNEYNYDKILKDKLRLALIVSFDKQVILTDYFDKNIVDLANNHEFDDLIAINSKGFELHDKVPFYSLFELCVFSNSDHLLYSLYNYNRFENNLLIPEGVERVELNFLREEYISRIISEYLDRKKNTFPKGLKSICGYMRKQNANYYYYNNINFNDDLEYLTIGVDTCIPSSVEEIDNRFEEHDFIGYIKFLDFKNSKIVNNKEKFIDFLEKFSTSCYTGKKEVCIPSKSTLDLRNKYRTGRFTTSDHTSLYVKDYVKYIYKNKMLFYAICFLDQSTNMEIMISGDDLNTEFNKTSALFENKCYGSADFDKIYDKIRKIILEKSGYDIDNKDSKRESNDKKLIYDIR